MQSNVETKIGLKVMSYNAHHGEGIDGLIDIARLARRIEASGADLIGLQEVDLGVARTEGQDQMAELGKLLGYHTAFGSAMAFGGGQYGLGVLSRFPISESQVIRLPVGKEPRIGLVAHIDHPSGVPFCLVSTHFDCLADDSARFSQAQALADGLSKLGKPFILMGDFNDVLGSRTLDVFQQTAIEAAKPADNRFTFTSTSPEQEIDFIFVAPPSRWSVEKVEVVDDPVTSDHRPVVAELNLLRP